MYTGTLRKYTLLILCLLCLPSAWAQRRFKVDDKPEYELGKVYGFTFKDVEDDVDAFWGLHASQYAGSHHLLGFSVEGAWTSFVSNWKVPSIRPGGGAAGFHLLYEYQYSGLLVQTGLGINFQEVYTNLRDTGIYHFGMHDKWDGVEPAEFTLKHEFYDRQDRARNLYVQVPLYVGQYLFSTAGIGYWLAGFHVNCAFKGDTRQTLNATTKALYEPFLGVWHEMDNHGYRYNVPLERTGERLRLQFDVLAHVEAGYEYTTFYNGRIYRTAPGNRLDCRLRFAGFVDFGMLNICPRTNKDLYAIPEESIYDFSTYRMDHVFSTADARKYWMRNLYIGIRFTVLFGIPANEPCILCDPWKH